MRRLVRAAGAVGLAVALLAPAVGAQEATPAGDGFRAGVEPDILGRRGPAVVGWLYNDQAVSFTNVRVRVDVLDDAGQTIGSGQAYVYGSLPARGRSYFFVPVSRMGHSYRATVIRFDRLEAQ